MRNAISSNIKWVKNYLSSLPSQLSSRRGFTLIELVIVFSVTSIISVLGIAGFTVYNQVQTLQTAAADFASTLNLARSRSLSQIRLSQCTGTLQGYKVNILIPNIYTLSIQCSGLNVIYTKTLPDTVIFKGPPDTSPTSFFFPVLTGGVQAAGQVVMSGFGRDKTIIVNSLGGIRIQ